MAHEIARNGYVTEDEEILKLSTLDGWTVAFMQVLHGWEPNKNK